MTEENKMAIPDTRECTLHYSTRVFRKKTKQLSTDHDEECATSHHRTSIKQYILAEERKKHDQSSPPPSNNTQQYRE